jgi:hypothetical protein
MACGTDDDRGECLIIVNASLPWMLSLSHSMKGEVAVGGRAATISSELALSIR